LFGQAIDDLDAGKVALVHGAIESLAGKGFLVQGAVGIPVEEAAQLVLELMDAFDGLVHQRPCQFLVGQPFAAGDGVHEMPLSGIGLAQRRVVAALHHARAAAFAQQAFAGHGDVQGGVRVVRMQGREQAGSAGAQAQDVGADYVGLRRHDAPSEARISSRRLLTSPFTSSYSEPPWLSMATSKGPRSRMRNFQSDSGLRSSRSTSSICSIQVVSSAAVPPTMPR